MDRYNSLLEGLIGLIKSKKYKQTTKIKKI